MVGDVVQFVFSLLTGLLSLLPASFVRGYIDSMDAIQYLSYINYFIPFNICFQIGQVWLGCCGAYLVFYYTKSVYDESAKGGK